MTLSPELWFRVFNVLTQKSQAKFSCVWNLYNLSSEEIQILLSSDNILYDSVTMEYTGLLKLVTHTSKDTDILEKYGYTGVRATLMFALVQVKRKMIKY